MSLHNEPSDEEQVSSSFSGMRKLYLKISLTLFSILVLLGLVYVVLTGYMVKEYIQESRQIVHRDLARDIVNGVRPLMGKEIEEGLVQHIVHFIIAINPSVDVYLLDPDGNIFTSLSKEKQLDSEKVDLSAIKTFINAENPVYIKGDDPKAAGEKKAFSAAPILNQEEELIGYVYVILDNQKNAAAAADLIGSYIPYIGIQLFSLALFVALVIGLLAIWLLTKNLRRYVQAVNQFKNGNLNARVGEDTRGDFPLLGETFNDMADKILANIEDLKTVESERKEFIANVSHDLRTPLVVVQGYAETLLLKGDEIPSPTRRKYLDIILDSARKLSNMIGQLFEYSKLESRQIEVRKEPFQIADLLQDAFYNYHVLAKDKAIHIQLDHPKNLPLVLADISLVERVIQNLMDNAIKFTPPDGEISIHMKSLGHEVEISISNTGAGIPPEQQALIFERFRKMENGDGKNFSGAGLGLAIVKKILELHDTDIRVQSQLNEGATFTFALPIYTN